MHIAQPTGAACRLILHQQQPATYLGLQKTHQQLTFWLYGCFTETPSWGEQECLTQNCGVWNRCRVFGQSPEGACSASITWDVLLIIPVQLEHWKLYLKQQSPRFRWDGTSTGSNTWFKYHCSVFMNQCSNGYCSPFPFLITMEKFAYLQVFSPMWVLTGNNSPVARNLGDSSIYLLSPEFRFTASNCAWLEINTDFRFFSPPSSSQIISY